MFVDPWWWLAVAEVNCLNARGRLCSVTIQLELVLRIHCICGAIGIGPFALKCEPIGHRVWAVPFQSNKNQRAKIEYHHQKDQQPTGHAELLVNPYHKKVPLPRIPNNPVHPVDATHMAQVAIGAVNLSAAPINCWNMSQLIRTTAPLACDYLSYWAR